MCFKLFIFLLVLPLPRYRSFRRSMIYWPKEGIRLTILVFALIVYVITSNYSETSATYSFTWPYMHLHMHCVRFDICAPLICLFDVRSNALLLTFVFLSDSSQLAALISEGWRISNTPRSFSFGRSWRTDTLRLTYTQGHSCGVSSYTGFIISFYM